MMRKKGMFFGSHSISHTRLGLQKKNIQFKEISKSTDALKRNIQKGEHFYLLPIWFLQQSNVGDSQKNEI